MSITMAEGDDAGTEVECEKCGYVWTYSGQMFRATCPRCSHNTPTGLGPDDDEDP